jgi:hypothetical protein
MSPTMTTAEAAQLEERIHRRTSRLIARFVVPAFAVLALASAFGFWLGAQREDVRRLASCARAAEVANLFGEIADYIEEQTPPDRPDTFATFLRARLATAFDLSNCPAP